jgi:type VII secretion integral membrane protein EccD
MLRQATAGREIVLTTVRVITGSKATDVSLPAEEPIKDWIEQAVEHVADLYQGLDIGFDFQQETTWTIAPVGAPPAGRDQSLNAARIVDGNLVVLQPVSQTERYRPLAEDVIDAVAILNRDPVFARTDLVAWLGWWTALMLFGVAAGGVYGWSAAPGTRLWWGPGLLVFGLVCAVVAAGLGRREQPQLGFAVGGGAVVNLAAGAGLTVPLPDRASWLGAPQFAAAAVAVVICLLFAPGGASRWRAWTAFFVAGGIITAVAAAGIGYGQDQWVWPGVVFVGLLLVKNAAKWVMRVARITLPPIPTPGQEVTLDQLDPAAVDVAAEAGDSKNQQLWTQIIASVPSSSARLAERSMLTQHLLAGFMAAGSVAAAAGTVMLLQRGHFLPHTAALCVLMVIVFVFRARLPADRRCVWALLTAAAGITIGAVVKLVTWWPAWAALTTGVSVAIAVVVLTAVAATSENDISTGRVKPRLDQIQQRWLEHLDTIAVAATIPLLGWVCGLYDTLRNLPWLNS